MHKPLLVRIALINHSDERIELPIKTEDAVGWFELLQDAPVGNPDRLIQKQSAATPWKAVLEPGGIYGFATTLGAEVPLHPKTTVFYANGKDPWPKPPPPPPRFAANVTDYEARFAAFLDAVAVEPEYDRMVVDYPRDSHGVIRFSPPRDRRTA